MLCANHNRFEFNIHWTYRKPAVLSGLFSGEVIADVSEREVAVATSKEEKQLLTVRNRSEKLEVCGRSSSWVVKVRGGLCHPRSQVESLQVIF